MPGWLHHAIDAAAHITRHMSDTPRQSESQTHALLARVLQAVAHHSEFSKARVSKETCEVRCAGHNVTQHHIISGHSLIALMALIAVLVFMNARVTSELIVEYSRETHETQQLIAEQNRLIEETNYLIRTGTISR